MFGFRYFARRYFAGRFWAPADDAGVIVGAISGQAAGSSTASGTLTDSSIVVAPTAVVSGKRRRRPLQIEVRPLFEPALDIAAKVQPAPQPVVVRVQPNPKPAVAEKPVWQPIDRLAELLARTPETHRLKPVPIETPDTCNLSEDDEDVLLLIAA